MHEIEYIAEESTSGREYGRSGPSQLCQSPTSQPVRMLNAALAKPMAPRRKRAWHDGTNSVQTIDYVTRRLNALLAELKTRSGGLTFAETPPSAISRFAWSPEAGDASSFRANLERSIPN